MTKYKVHGYLEPISEKPKKEKTKITSARIETRVSDKLKLLHYFLPADEDMRLSFS